MDKVQINEEKLFNNLVGQTLSDSYKLGEKIASGGMGAVFRATNIKTNEPVAIKVLSPSLSVNPTFLKRFEREAKVGWMLSHPNIVKVYEFGATPDNLLFIVMEYVTGEPLDDYLEGKLPLSPKHCLEIVKPLASALEMAHKHSILHRDLKPANILINKSEGQVIVKLVDFGVVKLLEADIGFNEAGLTAVGEVFGTPQYMAPEQLMEDPINSAADVYSLGIMVYEMLAGALPFNGLDPQEAYLFKMKKIIPELSKKFSFIPKAFDPVIKKAIDSDPIRRYQSAEDFIKDFELVVEKYPQGKIVGDKDEEEPFSFLEDTEQPKTSTPQTSISSVLAQTNFQGNSVIVEEKVEQISLDQTPIKLNVTSTKNDLVNDFANSANKASIPKDELASKPTSIFEKKLLIASIVLVIVLIVLVVLAKQFILVHK